MSPRREAGFTLLEMLVALVVFGLVMAGLTQTFHFGLIAFNAGSRATETESLAASDAALRRMIAAAAPGGFTGRANGLAFTTRLPPGAGLPGLADIAILVAGDDLVLRYVPHPPGPPLRPPPPPRTEILLHHVSRLTVSYLAPAEHGPPGWIGQWRRDGLPLLIRLHLGFTDGRLWPDLVAAPVAPAD